MIIEIPKKFYKRKARNKYAKVKNGILEVHGFRNFRRLMIEITYAMKGKNRCYYCKRPLLDSKVTVDHLFPEAYGGITVTNNLVPACKVCNNMKADMNEQEYREWLNIKDPIERKNYYKKISTSKSNRKFSIAVKGTYDIPEEWIRYQRLDTIRNLEKTNVKSGKTYWKIYDFTKKYGKLPRVLVVSKNGVVLDGKIAYEVAEELGLELVPVVVLENVLAFIE